MGGRLGQNRRVHPDADVLRPQTERWFVQRGIPHAIDDYSASGDVFTRAAPFLSGVFALEVFASFDDRFSGWGQLAAFLGGLAILAGAVVVVNRMRGRRRFQLPDDVGIAELGLFALVPALLPLLFSGEPGWRSAFLVGFNVVLLFIVYFVIGYGLLPMIRFGAEQMRKRFREIGQLLAKALPMLILLTTFVFLNAEMWQVASDAAPAFYGIAVGFLLFAAIGFMALRAPREVASLGAFSSWGDVQTCARRSGAPIAELEPSDLASTVEVPPLGRSDRFNVSMLVVIAQLVQVMVVAIIIGLFYVGFGLLMVRSATIAQWTTSPHDPLATFDLFGSSVVVTWEHLAVAGFIAAFSALQFGVAMLTDGAYREEFYEDVTGEIREVLAVRALYYDTLVEADAASWEAAADAGMGAKR